MYLSLVVSLSFLFSLALNPCFVPDWGVLTETADRVKKSESDRNIANSSPATKTSRLTQKLTHFTAAKKCKK